GPAQVRPAGEAAYEHLRGGLDNPVDGREHRAIAGADGLARGDRGGDPAAVADYLGDRVDVAQVEPGQRRRRAEVDLARDHDEQVGAESLDLLLDLLLGARADRDQYHHGGDPDDHPEHGQPATQPVGTQGVQRDPPGFGDPHVTISPSRISIWRL